MTNKIEYRCMTCNSKDLVVMKPFIWNYDVQKLMPADEQEIKHAFCKDCDKKTEINVISVPTEPEMYVYQDVRILKLDVLNKDREIFPSAVMQQEVARLKSRHFYGQIGMPDKPVDWLKHISHIVFDLAVKEGYLVGTVRLLMSDNCLIGSSLILKTMLDKDRIVFRMKASFLYDHIGDIKNIIGMDISSINAVRKDQCDE